MNCPYCDSRISSLPDNRVCPHCGAPLGDIRPEKKPKPVFPKPPLGVYKDAAGYIEIGKDSVSFLRRQFIRATKRTIPYSELYAVAYKPGEMLSSGYLCVRGWQDRQRPLPLLTEEIVYDATSVYFRRSKNEEFRRVYVFLEKCVQIARAAHPEWNTDGAASLFGRYDGYCGYLEADAQGVTVYKDAPLASPTKRVIPYSEIAEVAFCQAKSYFSEGALSIRQRGDGKRMDRALRDAKVDDTSIDFQISANEQMRKLYEFLTEHARKNSARWANEEQ